MGKLIRNVSVVGAAVAALTIGAAPAYAGPPDRAELDFFGISADEQNGLVVFMNISRDGFCAWAADGFAGPPPVAGLIPGQAHETGQGAVVGSLNGDVPVELWQVDDDVPPFVSPCEDTDDQEGPWAVGQLKWTANSNDFENSLTRTNVSGETIRGTVVDGDGGTWHYVATLRVQVDQDGAFRVVVDKTNLTPISG